MTTDENKPQNTTPQNAASPENATPESTVANEMPEHDTSAPEAHHPFGYWVTAVDRLLAAEFAAAFADERISRRDWRILNLVDGTVPSDHPRPPVRPDASGRPLRTEKLRHVIELGWVAPEGDGWILTAQGRAAKDRLSAVVAGIRSRVSAAVNAEEFTSMTASLERIARELGWQEGTRLPRSARGRHRRHTSGADPRHGHEHGHGHGHGQHLHIHLHS